jgi:lysozyme
VTKDNPRLIAQLVEHEGLETSPYRCTAGKLTIGVGHNLNAKPISRRAAVVILEDDLADVFADLDRQLPWWRDLDDVRQMVLVDMCFNLGIAGLLGFRMMLTSLREGCFQVAAEGMVRSKWYGQVGRRAKRLVEMMRTGQHPN